MHLHAFICERESYAVIRPDPAVRSLSETFLTTGFHDVLLAYDVF